MHNKSSHALRTLYYYDERQSRPQSSSAISKETSGGDVTCQACRGNSSSVSSKPPLLTRVARSGPRTRLEEPVRTYITSQIKVAFDWEIRFSDFEIEREIRVIRKRISPARNPFSGWISIRKSKSGFHRFPFYRSIGKSEKGFAKLFSSTTAFFLLIVRVRARPLFS